MPRNVSLLPDRFTPIWEHISGPLMRVRTTDDIETRRVMTDAMSPSVSDLTSEGDPSSSYKEPHPSNYEAHYEELAHSEYLITRYEIHAAS